MEFLYDDVRNARFMLHSEKRLQGGRPVFVLQLINTRTNTVDKEQTLRSWQEYSSWYQQMVVLLRSAP
jgi:hypothetical protein